MRTLVIAGEYPWPVNSGSRIRLATVLSGLARCGPTELFSIVPSKRTDFDPPTGIAGLARMGRVGFDDRTGSGLRLLRSAARPSMPLEVPWQDGPLASRAAARFMVGRYDLVWYFGIRPWVLVGGLVVAPTILDFVDLDDQKVEARRSIPRPPAEGLATRLRRTVGRVTSDQEIGRWRRLHRAGGRVDLSVVCSQLDAERATAAGVPRVSVIPNSYPRVDHPRGRVAVASPPTVLFPGTLRYPPNADAAGYLAGEVGPALRTLVPDVRIRLVGRGTEALSGLDDPPRLTMVGQVEDIEVELAGADVIVVPLRFGSGTRLKILEAFAHRLPVVSTTLGAEGLDVEDGVHLLLGDTPADLAAACARLLTDEPLREALTSRAHQHYLDRFESQMVEGRIASLATSVVESWDRRPASMMITR